ncbi:MAG: hypothetical protein ABII26_07540, partial [Pseudomonadota bacterium]
MPRTSSEALLKPWSPLAPPKADKPQTTLSEFGCGHRPALGSRPLYPAGNKVAIIGCIDDLAGLLAVADQ